MPTLKGAPDRTAALGADRLIGETIYSNGPPKFGNQNVAPRRRRRRPALGDDVSALCFPADAI
jgi:hypothetical protein